MHLAEPRKTLQAVESFCREAQLNREAYEVQRNAIARIAVLDQKIAKCLSEELESVTKLTDRMVAKGHLLLESLALFAQLGRLGNELMAIRSTKLTDSELASWEQATATLSQERNCFGDDEARRFISDCLRQMEFCIQGVAESLTCEDVYPAVAFSKQASRLLGVMREIQDSWPWVSSKALDESWKQYERGELMDFESFKNELLKAAQ